MKIKSTIIIVLCLSICLMATAPMAHAEDPLDSQTQDSTMDWYTMFNFWAQFELKVAEWLIGGPINPPMLNIEAQ